MLTTHQEIVEYWSQHQDECGLSVDWTEAHKLCWRCAHKRLLQRCHIIPRALGGTDYPKNLVLLCGQCHSEAPNVVDSDFMWTWLRAHAVSFYGTYWQQRGLHEYEIIYGEKPFLGIENPDKALELCREIIKSLCLKTSTHWGQGKLNPSTWAWIYRQVDLRLRNDA